jgi:hypothetical protein
MLNKGVLCLLTITLALFASPSLAPPASAAQTLVVDDDYDECEPAINVYTSITQALGDAVSGDTIRVCEGDYTDQVHTSRDDHRPAPHRGGRRGHHPRLRLGVLHSGLPTDRDRRSEAGRSDRPGRY